MKLYLIIFLLFFFTITQAQKSDFSVKKGGYITEELGGYGLPAFTLGYEYVQPLSENMFLSTRVGVNGMVWLDAFNIGLPHGVAVNLGKRHFYFEAGLNGWYGFFQDDEMKWDGKENYNGYFYLIGANMGLNTAFTLGKSDFLYRIYVNPWYNTGGDLLRKTFIGFGTGFSVRLHN